MAKIYYRKYKDMILSGEITFEQAIELITIEVPERWKQAVIDLLEGDLS